MAHLQSFENITELPSKVLGHIFTYLPVSDRKNVSLMCRAWNEQAFSLPSQRLLPVTLKLGWTQYERQRELHEYDILRNSSRDYKQILISFQERSSFRPCTDEQFQLVLDLMGRFGTDIESFECKNYFTAAQLRLLVDLIPNVSRLVVGLTSAESPVGDLEFPVLTKLNECNSLENLLESHAIDIPAVMPNLHQLTANFREPDASGRSLQVLQLLAPRLRFVQLYSTEYFFDISELHFPQVEELALVGNIINTNETVWRRFFERFSPTLKVLTLQPELVHPVLDIVTERCPLLHWVYVRTNVQRVIPLRCLSFLRELKFLGLAGTLNVDMLRGLHSMPSVEDLQLHTRNFTEDERVIFVRFAQLLPNVTNLSIVLEERSAFAEILSQCRNYSQVRRLHFHQEITSPPMIGERDVPVPDLGLVEELSLVRFDIPIRFDVPSANLTRVVLDQASTVRDCHLARFTALYPNLRYLEAKRCEGIGETGIMYIQACLPNVVVNFTRVD